MFHSPSILVSARCQAGEQRNSSYIDWCSAPTHDAHARVGARAKDVVGMLNGQRRYGRGCSCMYHTMCVCGPMYVCMMRSIICVGVGGIGVGGDGDVYLGESCTEEAENKGAQLRMMTFISLTLHGWTSGFFKRRCREKSEGNHV